MPLTAEKKTNASAVIVPPPPDADKSTNAQALVVPTPLSGADTNDIRDIRNPVVIPSGWAWLGWVLGTALLAAMAWLVWKRWKARKTGPPPLVIIPPHERAREKLREALALIGQPRPFCIAVSDTIRVYLEERFDLHAPERTTEEFLAELQTSQVLGYDQKQTLGEFLGRCDLVKFARYEPERSELEALYNAAVRLIEETEPTPVNAGQPGSEEAAPEAAHSQTG